MTFPAVIEHRVARWVAAVALAVCAGHANAGVGVEVSSGAPWNAPLPLRIEQSGAPPLRLGARYETRPFELPLYYRVRVLFGAAGAPSDWAVELVHHKVYLVDPPPEVQSFSVSHGYNLVMLSRGWARGPVWIRLGLGPVVAHPESTVRGRTLDDRGGFLGSGYYVAGGVTAAMVEHRFPLAAPMYLVVGGMLTAGFARVPVADGHADVPNVAAHGLVGIGVM